MNNKPGQHRAYSTLQIRIQQGAHDEDEVFAQKAGQYVQFLDNPATVEDPAPLDKPEPDDHNNPNNIPGRFEMRMLRHLLNEAGKTNDSVTMIKQPPACLSGAYGQQLVSAWTTSKVENVSSHHVQHMAHHLGVDRNVMVSEPHNESL